MTGSDRADDLLASIVQANVDDLARTTDRLLESKDRDIRELAEALLRVERILADATVIDRATERSLRLAAGVFDRAQSMLDRARQRHVGGGGGRRNLPAALCAGVRFSHKAGERPANTQPRSTPHMAKYATRKDTPAAKSETRRRREVRRFKGTAVR